MSNRVLKLIDENAKLRAGVRTLWAACCEAKVALEEAEHELEEGRVLDWVLRAIKAMDDALAATAALVEREE